MGHSVVAKALTLRAGLNRMEQERTVFGQESVLSVLSSACISF